MADLFENFDISIENNQNISSKNIKELKRLRQKVAYYKHAYYNENKSLITDGEYDKLEKKLKDLESLFPSSYLRSLEYVGIGAKANFKPIEHKFKMYSLDNIYNQTELEKWLERVQKMAGAIEAYLVEPKIDGIALNLRYKEGKLLSASTRGDGNIGDDITANISNIYGIPYILPQKYKNLDFEILGEVYILIEDFYKSQNNSINGCLYANPRNLAGGILRREYKDDYKEIPLYFFMHGISGYNAQNSLYQTYLEFQQAGFAFSKHIKAVKTKEEIIKHIKYLKKISKTLDYEIDGAVIKVDNCEMQNLLGFTSKAPKYAIAYKYPPKQTQTRLLDIKVAVGRTGRITPFAILEEVELDGTRVSKATLHNLDIIASKGILIGDIVTLRKAAEIIPEILAPVIEKRTGIEKAFNMPSVCPSCKSPLGYEKKGDKDLRCLNFENCKAQIHERIKYIASRQVLDIAHLGDKSILNLLNAKKDGAPLLKTEADLFDITLKDLFDAYIEKPAEGSFTDALEPQNLKINNNSKTSSQKDLFASIIGNDFAKQQESNILEYPFRKKRNSPLDITHHFNLLQNSNFIGSALYEPSRDALNFIENLNKAKSKPFYLYICALNIRHIGKANAISIAKKYNNIEDLQNAKYEDLVEIDGIGEIMAESIIKSLNSLYYKNLIKRWTDAGVKWLKSDIGQKDAQSGVLANISIAITGAIPGFGRLSAQREIIALGGRMVSGVSKNLSLLIAADDKKTSTKFLKAKELGIKIISADNFKKFLENPKEFL